MAKKNIRTQLIDEDIKKSIFYAKNSVKCKHCGHSILMGRQEKKICNWCGRYVFKDDKTEFIYRTTEKLGEMI